MDTVTLAKQLPVAAVATDSRGRRTTPRRHRPIEEKLAILAEAAEPGASVAAVARRHQLNANVLFGWRRLHAQGVLEAHTRPPRGRKLLPVKLLPSRAARAAGGAVRIEFPNGIMLTAESATDAVLLERLIGLLRR